MAEYVVAQAAVLIVPSLDKFQEKLNAKLKEIELRTGAIKIDARLDSKKAVAEYEATKAWMEKQDITLRAKVDTRTLTEIRHKYEDLANQFKKGLLLDLKIAGLNLLPQAASAMAALNASIVQLSQSAVLLPGIFSGVLSSIGALATGISGVKAAFKEYTDAQKNNIQTSAQARNNAINVQNAYRDLGRAFKDAQRNLEDLNAQLRDAPLDEADAIIRVQEAIAEANDKAGKSGLQQQKDALAVIKAENALADTRMRNSRLVQDVAEANAKGVAGSDRVTEATDRLAKAQETANAASGKLSDSLKKLSPNAQSFVTAMTGMASQWMAFKNATQDRLFAGLDQEIKTLAQNDLPMLQKGFGSIADSLNGNVKAAFKSLQTETNKGFLDKIFGDTAAAQGNLSKSFDPLIDSFLRLSAAGTDMLPRLSNGLTDLLTRFDNFISRTSSDGSLDKWMNNGIDALKDLGNSLVNVASIMNSLSDAFTGSGGRGLLPALEQGTAKLASFLKSAEGQAKLEEFFKSARDELNQWKPVLEELPTLLKNVSAAGKAWADILLPFLTTAGRALAEHPALVQAVFGAFMLWKNVAPVIKGVGNAFEAVSDAIKKVHGDYPSLIGKTEAVRGKFRDLSAALVGPGSLVAAATIAATFLITNYVSAQDEAAAAARRHKSDLDELKTTLDAVTGSATKATKALVAKNLFAGDNPSTGQSNPEAFKTAVPDPAKRQQIVQDIVSGNLDGALAAVPAATAADIEKTKAWQNQDSRFSVTYRDFGLTPQDLADAVNGKPDAVAKYEAWVTKNNHIPGLSDAAGNAVAAATGINPTTLLDIQNELPANVKAGSITQNEIYANTSGIQQDQQSLLDQNAAANGSARLIPGTPFDSLGVVGQPALGTDGGGLVTQSAPPAGSPLAEQFRNEGVTFTPNATGGFNVSLSPEAASKYLQKFASGGLISGPGSGTSDSILARLSHGEFVVNAASTQQHLPLLEQINGGKLPGYAPGGPVVPPIVPDIAPMSSPSKVITGSVGAKGVATSGSLTGTPKEPSFLQKAGAWAKRNLLPHDFKETSTATLHWNPKVDTGKSAYSTLYPGYGGLSPSLSQGDIPTSRSPKPISFPDFLGQVTSNIKGDYQPLNKSVDPVPASPSPVVPKPGPVVPPAGSPPSGGPKPAPNSVTPTVPLAAETGATVSPHVGSGVAPGPGVGSGGVPSVTIPLPTVGVAPNGQIVLDLSGSGALPDTKSSAASAAPNAPIIPNANIVGYLTQLGQQSGLGVGSSYDVNHGGTHPADGGQHSMNRAIDLGSAEKAQDGSISRWVQAWMSDPVKVAATRQLIFRGPDGDYGIINGRILQGDELRRVYGDLGDNSLSQHPDHVHLALEGVPADAVSGFMPGMPNGLSIIGANGQVISSPSNMPPAMTPTGVPLPQLTYGDGGVDAQGMADNWVQYVQGSWQKSMENFAQNAGQIGLKFLSGLTGIDFSSLSNIGQSVVSGIGGGSSGGSGGKSGGKDSGLPANGDLGSIIQSAAFNQLPPSVQQAYLQAYQAQQQQQQGVQYDPKGGAEQWRPVVRQALTQVASKYGITNVKAWEDALIKQIDTESGGNPNIDNLNDSNGRGGTQQVFGLGQFLPETFKAHNITGGDIHDPVAQIYAMIDYVVSRYGMNSTGGPNWIGRGQGYASGGSIMGSGNGRSDSILARVSNGEYIVKASAAQKNLGLLNAINSGLPGFADGMLWPVGQPAPVTPPPVTAPDPTPAPIAPDPMGPAADAQAGIPAAPTPVTDTQGPGDAASTTLSDMGAALGGIGDALQGAQAPAGGDPTGDPRAVMGAAPQNFDHNNPAVSKGIEGAAGAIAGAVSTAMAAASVAANAQAPGSGQGISSASGMVTGLITAGGSAVSGAVNILSSLGVGTLGGGGSSTAGAYGTPLLPGGGKQEPYSGPAVVNNWNGGVHTSNNEEFYKQQQRKELQNASPYLPQR